MLFHLAGDECTAKCKRLHFCGELVDFVPRSSVTACSFSGNYSYNFTCSYSFATATHGFWKHLSPPGIAAVFRNMTKTSGNSNGEGALASNIITWNNFYHIPVTYLRWIKWNIFSPRSTVKIISWPSQNVPFLPSFRIWKCQRLLCSKRIHFVTYLRYSCSPFCEAAENLVCILCTAYDTLYLIILGAAMSEVR